MVDLVARSAETKMLDTLSGVIEHLDQQQMGHTTGNFNKDLVTTLDAVLSICTSISNRLNKLEDHVKNL